MRVRQVCVSALLVSSVIAAPTLGQTQCSGWRADFGQPGTGGWVRTLAMLPGGDVVVGGWFTSAGGLAASHIARYNFQSRTWSPLGSGTNNDVLALLVLPDGDIIAGGPFSMAGGVPAGGVARFDVQSGTWSGLGGGVSGRVHTLTLRANGDLVVGGNFSAAGGLEARNIAGYSFSSGSWYPLGAGVTGGQGTVEALLELPDGHLLVGGSFHSAGGQPASGLARYDSSDGTWTGTVPVGLMVRTLCQVGDRSVFVGGSFTTVNGQPAQHAFLYDLQTGEAQLPTASVNEQIIASATMSDGRIAVGGEFTNAGGVPGTERIAICDPADYSWSAFVGDVDEQVQAIVRDPTGSLLVAGFFNEVGSLPVNYVARYFVGEGPPTISVQPPAAEQLRPGVQCGVEVVPGSTMSYRWRQNGQNLFNIPGLFSGVTTRTLTISSVDSSLAGTYDCRVASACGTTFSEPVLVYCVGDFTRDGFIDGDDVIGFFSVWDAGDIAGDVTLDGGVDGDDVIEFFERWDLGC